ncbi:hypothetical protein [Pseudomonas sp. AK106]
MQFSDVKQVKQVIGVGNANTLLNEGWALLGIVPASLAAGGASVIYVFGSSEPAEPKKPTNISAAALAQANEGLSL